jgi:hypothetical protein
MWFCAHSSHVTQGIVIFVLMCIHCFDALAWKRVGTIANEWFDMGANKHKF